MSFPSGLFKSLDELPPDPLGGAYSDSLRRYAQKWWFGELAEDPDPTVIEQLIQHGRAGVKR